MIIYLSRAIHVIRLSGIFILFCGFNFLCAQVTNVSSGATLEQSANELLEREVLFTNKQTLLSESLRELGQQHGINIVFSGSTLGATTVKPIDTAKFTIQQILNKLLQDTRFDYLVVGQTIAIVTAKTPKNEKVSDSILADPKRHIVSHTSQSFDHIPARERRLMRRLLLQELDKHQLRVIKKKDTTYVTAVAPFPKLKLYAQMELPIYNIKHRSRGGEAWKSDLKQTTTAQIMPSAQAGFEIHKEKYFLSAGLSLSQVNLNVNWVDSSNVPPVEVPPPSQAGKPKYRSATDRYLMLSVPLCIGYTLRLQKHMIAPVVSMAYSYVLDINHTYNKFEKYYELKNANVDYTERVNRHLIVCSVGLRYDYTIYRQWSVKSSVAYGVFLNPLEVNTLFKTYPQSITFNLGVAYQLFR